MTKTIFITGASTGIGRATAKLFAAKGWKVIATMRKPENETELHALDQVTVLPLDVNNLAQIRETTQQALALGDIDVVFNNAGYGLFGAFEAMTDEQLVQQMETNFFGVVRVTQAFIPYFRERKAGLFITTGSSAGLMGFPMSSMYDASKFALEGWAESLSYELNELGIGIKTIEPGLVATEISTKSVFAMHPAYEALTNKFTAMLAPNRAATTSEQIAEVVYGAATDGTDTLRYVCGDDAKEWYALRLAKGDEVFRQEMKKLLASVSNEMVCRRRLERFAPASHFGTMKREHLKPRVYRSIAEMQRAFGLRQPLHPLISLLDFDKVRITAEMLAETFVMDFYNITYNESAGCRMRYGQTTYDFQQGGMFFSSPGQPLTGIQTADTTVGFSLLVHPDFLRNYPLGAKIKQYGFFSYSVNESLHLSGKEDAIITGIARNMSDELETAIDDLSQDVLISQLELMLNYSQRFYKRQFITRKVINNALLEKLDQLLNNYFNDETALLKGLPSVQYLSDELHVSPRYLGDMLRALTGQNTQQHIHNKLIEKAKEVLAFSDLTVGEIAYQLGFEHPQSFSKLFKSKTNFSPLEFRASFN